MGLVGLVGLMGVVGVNETHSTRACEHEDSTGTTPLTSPIQEAGVSGVLF